MPVVMKPVVSSVATEVGYDPETEQLHVRYAPTLRNPAGNLVVYGDMDAETANDILTAPSIGSALHEMVRGKFPFKNLSK